LANDVVCKSWIGIELQQFEQLWQLVAPKLAATTTQGTPSKRRRTGRLDGSDESHLGADVLLSDRQVLFETLNWLHSYESEVHMQGHTGVDARNAHRHLLRGLTALHDTIVPQCLPPMPTHDENADFWNDLVFEVDQMLEPKTRGREATVSILQMDPLEVRCISHRWH
jgi:hypothetical protein